MYTISIKVEKRNIMDIFNSPIKEKADYLEICAHCMGIRIISSNSIEKYFIDDFFLPSENTTRSYGFIVTYERVKEEFVPKQVTKVSPYEIQLRIDAMGLHFGE